MSINASITVLVAALLGWAIAGGINHLADGFIGRRACGHCSWAFQPSWPAALAYLRHAGRCPQCGTRLSVRPILIEVVTAILFVAVAARLGLTIHGLMVMIYLSILILISIVDLATRRIPNNVILPASALALIVAVAGVSPGIVRSLLGGGLALGIFLLAYLLGGLFLRAMGGRAGGSGPALGMGDVKLALFIGLATGYPGVMTALLAGTLAGAAAALGLIVWRVVQRRYRPFASMAYGPYLALGAIVALLVGG